MTKVAGLLVSSRRIIVSLFGLLVLSLTLVQCAHTPHAVSIQVIPNSASLTTVGQTVQFEAFAGILTGNESSTGDVTNQVTWYSSTASVATINPSGLATAVGAGTTTIKATLQSSTAGILEATATLTISAGGATTVPRDLASITIVPSSQTVSNVGETIQFAAIGNYNAPPTAVELTRVSWTSSDPTIATISSAGVATSVSPGTATITATAIAPVSGATIIGSATLTVSATAVPRDLVSITIIPNTQSLGAIGVPTQFTAVGNFSSAPTTVELTNLTSPSVTWSSSDPTVATINAAGLATSVSGGTATITATAVAPVSRATIVGVATLTVTAPTTVQRDLVSITIIPSSQNTTTVGESVQFTAIGNYNASPTTVDLTSSGSVTWKSSDVSVATIDPKAGLAIAVGAGLTTITASAIAPVSEATIVGTATLNSSATPVPRDLTSITIVPGSQSIISVGQTAQFIAIGNYSGSPTTQDLTNVVTWKSSDPGVATINSTGLAQPGLASAVSGGTTTIIAQSTNGGSAVITGVATLSVSANAVTRALTSITIIPTSQPVQAIPGESVQFIAIGNYSGAPTTLDLTDVVTWQSSDDAVGTINSNGFATANNDGFATITASCSWISTSAPTGSCSTANSNALIAGTATLQVSGNAGNGSILPTLTIYEVGSGTGSVTGSPEPPSPPPGLISCDRTATSSSCTGYYSVGTTVTLTATPDSGSSFGGWSSNCTPITANTCQVTMDNNEPVGVIFNTP